MISTHKPIHKFIFTAFFIAVFGAFSASAEEAGKAEPKASKFDAGKMIFEHVGDSHEWHILGEGEHVIAIPLPVILYTPKGLDFFMSTKFDHGKSTFQSKYNYRVEENNSVVVLNDNEKVDEAASSKIIDFSITKNVASLLFSAFLMFYVFLSVAATYKRNPNQAPKGMQSL